jgi:hypothetical protein
MNAVSERVLFQLCCQSRHVTHLCQHACVCACICVCVCARGRGYICVCVCAGEGVRSGGQSKFTQGLVGGFDRVWGNRPSITASSIHGHCIADLF